jgi:predicted Zn-dependent protease
MEETFHRLGFLLEVGRFTEAHQLLEQYFTENPGDPEAHLYAAVLAQAEEDPERAEQHIRETLRRNPQHRSAKLVLFDVLTDQERWTEAEKLILQLIKEDPEDPLTLALYAQLMLCTLHVDKAAALAEEALRRDPNGRTARLVHVLVETVRGNRSAVEQNLSELIKEDPESYRVVAMLYTVLVNQKRYREALQIAQQLLRYDPNNTALVDDLVELRVHTHPTAILRAPFVKWGWFGSVALWVIAIVTVRILARVNVTAALVFVAAYIGLCLYSWIHPPMLRWWIRRRGI